KGVITEIRETQNKFIYIVDTSKTARKLAKKDYIATINTNAFEFFINTMRANGISVVYKTSSTPTLKFQREFVIKKGSDIIAEFMRYFRDFAPILYYDSVSNILHIFLDASADTCYNITADAVLSYTITHKIRYASVMLTNGVAEQQQEEEEACRFDVSYSTQNSVVREEYEVSRRGQIKLKRRETVTYGNIANYIRSGSNYLEYLSQPSFAFGIVSKTVQSEDGKTERWGWIQKGWAWIPTLPQSPVNNAVIGDVAVHVPVYGFERIEEENEEAKKTIKTECGAEVELTIRKKQGYVYGLKGGGVLSADEAMRFNAIIPGDVKFQDVVGVSTRVVVKNSKAVSIQETAADITGGGVKARDMEITVPQQAPVSVVVLPNGILQLPQSPSVTQEGITTPGELSITIPDLTRESLPWVVSVINNLYLKHAQTLNITTPLLIVQVGYKIRFKGTNYVVEAYTHSITRDRATTTILARAL
ncbi:MAG: hypothetical protein QXM12_05180, partial [Nitrososphaerota archaeon]